jgi:hypothetical protein
VTDEQGAALELAFDSAFNALGMDSYEGVYDPTKKALAVFDGPQQIGNVATVGEAGRLLATAIRLKFRLAYSE